MKGGSFHRSSLTSLRGRLIARLRGRLIARLRGRLIARLRGRLIAGLWRRLIASSTLLLMRGSVVTNVTRQLLFLSRLSASQRLHRSELLQHFLPVLAVGDLTRRERE